MTNLIVQPERVVTDDLDALVSALPPAVAEAVDRMAEAGDLLEIVMDLGRVPSIRLRNGEYPLDGLIVQASDIEYVIERIGDFGDDNRAGHRAYAASHFGDSQP